ncbi:MAG: exodeoxyribonuclease VII small subunit [Eggerthellaceae bacterium]|jgi:exodeoxyribonuclease VII small subunit|nr:exodeoxyribonuclease VII small subunit [Eggerthellaceae bacterium]
MEHAPEQDFGAVKQRLEVIAEAVESPDMPLDEALDLFEEAVALGLKVGDMLEIGTDEADETADEAHIGEDI